MNDERKQAYLLEQYLEALRHNPNAPAPTGLDEATAFIAHKLLTIEQTQPPGHAIQDRLWRQLLLQPHSTDYSTRRPSTNGRYHEPLTEKETQRMINANNPVFDDIKGARRWPVEQSITLMAAMIAVVLFGIFLLFASNSGGSGGGHPAGSGALQASSSPIPSIVPTSTISDGEMNPTIVQTPTVFAPSSTPLATAPESMMATVFPTVEPFATGTPLPVGGYSPTSVDFALPPYQSEPEPIGVGDTVSRRLTLEEPQYMYTFDGVAGDLLIVSVDASGPVNIHHLVIEKSQVGNTMQSSGGGGGGGSGGLPNQPGQVSFGLNFKQDSVVWLLIAAPYPDPAITYTVRLSHQTLQIITYGEPFSGQWNPETPMQYFEFVGRRGEIISISINNPFDTTLVLEDAHGQILASDDDSGAGFNPEINNFQLPLDSNYRIGLAPYDAFAGHESVDLTVVVSLRENPKLSNGEVAVELYPKRPAEVITFEGQAGQKVRLVAETPYTLTVVNIAVMVNGQSLTTMQLLPASFGVADQGSESSGGSPETMIRTSREFIVPVDGTVQVFINADPALPYPYISANSIATIHLIMETLAE